MVLCSARVVVQRTGLGSSMSKYRVHRRLLLGEGVWVQRLPVPVCHKVQMCVEWLRSPKVDSFHLSSFFRVLRIYLSREGTENSVIKLQRVLNAICRKKSHALGGDSNI